MSDVVSYSEHGPVAVLKSDSPPVNALGIDVRRGLADGLAKAIANDAIQAILILCGGRTFFAGADIREFGLPIQNPSLWDVHEAMSACPKLIVTAIHGTALGGGLETALVSDYRCAVPSAKIGVPEVNLGILPGAGGTQRLPRLIGPEKALELIVSGRPIGARDALAIGAIDRIIEGDDLEAGALSYVMELLAAKAPRRLISAMTIDAASLPDDFFASHRARLAREKRGFFGPLKCVDAVEAAVTLPFAEGMARERQLLDECLESPQAAALRHAFFSERQVARIPGLPKTVQPRAISRVGVVGAGTMGTGIAINFLNAGLAVILAEMTAEALQRGIDVIGRHYDAAVKKGRLGAADRDRRLALLTGSLDMADLADCDLIIEAVFENMDVKREVFGKLDRVAKPGAILATNTSTLDVDVIAAGTSRPQDVIGLHFFSPAHIMRLLEIVRGARTSDEVLVTALELARRIGKIGIVSGVRYGFIANRMLDFYARQAELMLLEGATPMEVDQALFDFGMAMGPFAIFDLAGVDVAHMVRESNRDILPRTPTYYAIGDKLARLGRHGQKTGRGYHLYQAGSRVPEADAEVEVLIRESADAFGIKPRSFTADEIVDRCMLSAINEGGRLLEEGIAYRSGDIDQIWLQGFGFPAYRGGPMYYADQLGLDVVAARIETYRAEQGEDYWPRCALLEDLARRGLGFADWRDPRTAG